MKHYLFVFSFIFVISCTSSTVSKPENLLSENELEDVFFEMAIMQAAESTSRTDSGKVMDTYHYIKNRFGYDSTTIVNSTLYYADDYKEYEKLNQRVLDKLKEYRIKNSTNSSK